MWLIKYHIYKWTHLWQGFPHTSQGRKKYVIIMCEHLHALASIAPLSHIIRQFLWHDLPSSKNEFSICIMVFRRFSWNFIAETIIIWSLIHALIHHTFPLRIELLLFFQLLFIYIWHQKVLNSSEDESSHRL